MLNFVKEFFRQFMIFFFRPVKKGEWKKPMSPWGIFFGVVTALLYFAYKIHSLK